MSIALPLNNSTDSYNLFNPTNSLNISLQDEVFQMSYPITAGQATLLKDEVNVQLGYGEPLLKENTFTDEHVYGRYKSLFYQATTPLRVFIVDDNELLLMTLMAEMAENPAFQLVGHATNGEDAVDWIDKIDPDVVIMDITMPKMDGIQATGLIRAKCPNIRIVLLTCHTERNKVYESLNCGANAYCLKDMPTEELCNVILNKVSKKGVWFDPTIRLLIKNNHLDNQSMNNADERFSRRQRFK